MTFVITDKHATIRVSSVLNKDIKQYGKKYLLDGNDESCWSSDQGSPQWIKLEFTSKHKVSQVDIQFQGGFVGKDCHMKFGDNQLIPFYPEDINTLQKFSLLEPVESQSLLLMFNDVGDCCLRSGAKILTLASTT
ncbi:hypothetical protein WDU94_014811 [Cyamophila willieti]